MLLESILENEPGHPLALNNLGRILQAAGDLTGAYDCFKKAVELKPDYYVALNNLGNVAKVVREPA